MATTENPLLPPQPVSWADMHDDDDVDTPAPADEKAPATAHEAAEHLGLTTAHGTDGSSATAVVTVHPSHDGSPPTTVVTPLRVIMAEQKAEQEWEEKEARYDEIARQKAEESARRYYEEHGVQAYYQMLQQAQFYHYLGATTAAPGYGVAFYPGADVPIMYVGACDPDYVPWQVDPNPAYMGVPADILEHGRLPKATRFVFETPELCDLLCGHCRSFANIELVGGGSQKFKAAFCGSCLIKLSKAPALACDCGGPRFLTPLGKPKSPICSKCDKRKKKGRRKGHSSGERI